MPNRKKQSAAISKRLREVRQQLGLTLRGLSEKTRVPISTISEIETGKRNPSANLCAAIAKALDLNLNWLLLGKGDAFVEDTSGLTTEQHKALEAVKKDGKIAKIAVMLGELPEEERRRFYIRILEAKMLNKLLKKAGVKSIEELENT